jgi:2-phospho-L-lactate guanylyltransferase (CobY/MobA/RfbA family)
MILFTDLLKAGFSWSASPDSKLSVDVNGKKDLTDLNLHATLQTQHEKLKNAELSLKNKVSSVSTISDKTEGKLNMDLA